MEFYSIYNINKAYTEGVYSDTPQNRKLGRVGMSYIEYAERNIFKKLGFENILEIPKYTEQDIEDAYKNWEPYYKTKEFKDLFHNFCKAEEEKNEEEIERLDKLIQEKNDKHNVLPLNKLKNSLKPNKYYMILSDFLNKGSKSDIYKVVYFDKDKKDFILRPIDSTSSSDDIEASWLRGKFVEMNESQAKDRFSVRNDGDTFNGLSSSDIRLLKIYSYATPENSSLRKGQETNRTKQLKNIIDRTYNNEQIVYRGIRGDYSKVLLNKKIGDIIEEKGFSSTSFDKEIAKNIAKDDGIILKINTSKGYGKGINLTPYSLHPEEEEFLIQSNSKFKIISKQGNTIELEML